MPSPGVPIPKIANFTAIWDTGATGSLVTQKVIDACGLVGTGMTLMHGVSSSGMAETFLVNIYLPNHAAYPNVRVAKGSFTGGDILIGMDIIATGDFAITSPGGITQFSFRVPSVGNIDFVKQHNAAKFGHGVKKGPSGKGGKSHRRPKSQRKNKRQGKSRR